MMNIDVVLSVDFGEFTEAERLLKKEEAQKLMTKDRIRWTAIASFPRDLELSSQLLEGEPKATLVWNRGEGKTPDEALVNCKKQLLDYFEDMDLELHVVFPSRMSQMG